MEFVMASSPQKANPISLDLEALIAEALDPNTPFGRLEELTEHPEINARRAVLDNPNLVPTQEDGTLNTSLLLALAREFPEEVAVHPAFVLHALVEPNQEMLGVVVEVVRRTADVGLIETLLRTWGPHSLYVRQAVARNPTTPEDTLRLLGNKKTESVGYVRKAVAANPNTPVDLLRLLGNSKTESEWQVRASVAANRNTPPDVLRILGNEATESKWSVRKAVARNPHAPLDVLRTLGNEATESMGNVREAAMKALADRGLT